MSGIRTTGKVEYVHVSHIAVESHATIAFVRLELHVMTRKIEREYLRRKGGRERGEEVMTGGKGREYMVNEACRTHGWVGGGGKGKGKGIMRGRNCKRQAIT